MKKFQKAGYFTAGLLVAMLLASTVIPAAASLISRTIQVSTGVNIFVNEVKLNPKDAQGNPVEPFIYNGTVYLPVRAVADAFNTAITWEGSTSSVYLGKHNSEKPNILLKDMDYFSQTYAPSFLENDRDNMGKNYANSVTAYTPFVGWSRTYKLNGQYSRFVGTFYWMYNARSTPGDATLKVYADDSLVFDASVNKDTEPITFDIPLNGVLELRIEIPAGGNNGSFSSAIGDAGFYVR